jgi:hypothetical protein
MRILAAVLFLLSCFLAGAQENYFRKGTAYRAWIKSTSQQTIAKGILYEVSDSTVFLVSPFTYPEKTEYHFSDIDHIRLRSEKSVINSLTVGSAIGLGLGLIIGVSEFSEMPFMGGLFASSVGIAFAAFGAGVGALTGLIRDRYPVRSDQKNFEKYKGNLLYCSLIDEAVVAPPKFKHRYYGGLWMGITSANTDFGGKIPQKEYRGMHLTGLSSKFVFGYRFTPIIGANMSLGTSQFGIFGDDSERTWNYDTFMAGPVISVSASEKLRFEISPAVGYTTIYQYDGLNEFYKGSGLGYGLGGAIVFDMSKRWLASANIRYAGSKYEYSKSGNVSAIDTEIGVAYKFGKYSL